MIVEKQIVTHWNHLIKLVQIVVNYLALKDVTVLCIYNLDQLEKNFN
jgi:hypothetical protein